MQGDFAALPLMPSLDVLTQRLGSAPEVIRARAELERRQAMADVEQRRRTQDITLSVGAKKLGSENGGRTQAILGLAMPIPLFDRNDGNLLEALRRKDKASLELSASQLRLRSELAQASRRFETARANAQFLKTDMLPGAQSAVETATKGFEFGKFGFLDVLDAQRTFLQARSQYLSSLAEAYKAMVDIERSVGDPTLPVSDAFQQNTLTDQ